MALGPILWQPSELLKPFLVLEAASLFGEWNYTQDRLIRLLLLVALIGGILLQPNLSTAALCGTLLWCMAWSAGLSKIQLAQVAGGGGLIACISIVLRTYQRHRVISFWNPWHYSSQEGYQLTQSFLAVGSGGVQGAGWGLSQQKLFYLPIQYTDFIFSVLAEEAGWIGALALLIFLGVYACIGASIISNLHDPLLRLIATGSLLLLIGQAILNIGVCLGLLPTTGLPFPFCSYGGNSILSSFCLAGLLVRVARTIE
jgi:cell division protein FtsW